MPCLFFPTADLLRLTLSSGVVPPSIAVKSAWAGWGEQGGVWLEPEPLPRDILLPLSRLGVQVASNRPAVPRQRVGCWALAIPLRVSAPGNREDVILFDLSDAAAGRLAAKLRRTGSPIIGTRFLPRESDSAGRCWLTQKATSLSVIEGLAEFDPSVAAFREQWPGVWVAWGFVHPSPEQIAVPPGTTILLQPPRACRTVPAAVPIPALADFSLRVRSSNTNTRLLLPPRVALPLKLASARTPPESLWILSGAAAREFASLAAATDERFLRMLEVARLSSDRGDRLLIRPLESLRKAITLPWPAQGYYPHPRVSQLFVPQGRELRPPLREQAIARALRINAGSIAWLDADQEGEVRCHHAPRAAFGALSDQLVYGCPPVQALTSETDFANPFAFARFSTPEIRAALPVVEDAPEESSPLPVRANSTSATEPRSWWDRSLGRVLRRRRQEAEKPPVGVDTSTGLQEATFDDAAAERIGQKLSSADVLLHGNDWPARRRELESRLLDDLPRFGPADRAKRWAELAAVYGVVGNANDSAICWLNAVWESEAPPRAWLTHWLQAEARAAKVPLPELDFDRWLAEIAPRLGSARVLAAHTVAGATAAPAPLAENLGAVVACLDRNCDDLPIRSAWLARLALTRLCDGDTLGLARWRDRLLIRLREKGPGLDLDEPSFLRFHGTASAERFQTAREWLGRAREPIHAWLHRVARGGRLRAVGLDAETECTAAYIDLLLAWGLGCLGERTRSRGWSDRARTVLLRESDAKADPETHALLLRLFQHRIREAQEGRPIKAGWPIPLQADFERLPELARYAVDKFREHSRILEPRDHVDAFRGRDLRGFWGSDLLGERLQLLFERTDASVIRDEARQLLEICEKAPTSQNVPRVALTLLEIAPRLDDETMAGVMPLVIPALEWLETWLQSTSRSETPREDRLARYLARLVDRSLKATAAAGLWAAARPIVDYLVRRVSASDRTFRSALLLAAGPTFRALRKLGFAAESEVLLRHLDVGSHPSLRLGLATGWFAVGNDDAGNRILNDARDRLYLAAGDDDRERTALAIAYADALGSAPPRIALGRLEEIFQRLDRIALRGSTNSYFTLKPLQLIDTVVRSVVSEEFALGPVVRGWLDDDEFLIRRRIHRDLSAVLREQD